MHSLRIMNRWKINGMFWLVQLQWQTQAFLFSTLSQGGRNYYNPQFKYLNFSYSSFQVYISTIYGLIIDAHNGQLQVGVIASASQRSEFESLSIALITATIIYTEIVAKVSNSISAFLLFRLSFSLIAVTVIGLRVWCFLRALEASLCVRGAPRKLSAFGPFE